MIDKNEPADQKQEFNHSSCMHNEEFLRNQVMQDFTRITALESMLKRLSIELRRYYNTHPTKVEGTVQLLNEAENLYHEQS